MPTYEVELQIEATAWIDVDADSEDEAIAIARDSFRLSDADYYEVVDTSVKTYAEQDDAS